MIGSLRARLRLPSPAELESAQFSGRPEPIRDSHGLSMASNSSRILNCHRMAAVCPLSDTDRTCAA